MQEHLEQETRSRSYHRLFYFLFYSNVLWSYFLLILNLVFFYFFLNYEFVFLLHGFFVLFGCVLCSF